jgi:DNA-binding NarL/FixJ family response regulator
MKLPRVIIADDHTMVAEAVRQLIAPYFDVMATVADGHALIDAALSLKPDAVVVDVCDAIAEWAGGLPSTQGENAWLEDHFPHDERGSRTGARSNENRSVRVCVEDVRWLTIETGDSSSTARQDPDHQND